MTFFLLILATSVPAYILGSVNGAIIISKLLYRKDIRDYGSGNAGLTNFYRVFGKGGTLLVVFIDVLKSVAPVLFGGGLFAHYTDMVLSELWPSGHLFSEAFFGQVLAGLFVMLGHCFPLFHGFKGGKGVMAIGALVIVIDWRLALISWGVFIIITALTRYVSLGALLGSTAFLVSTILLDVGGIAEINVVLLCVVLIFIRHAPNIKRLVQGKESKLNLRRSKSQE